MNLLRNRKSEIRWRLVGILGKWIIDALAGSLRIQKVGFERVRDIVASRRYILAFWHSRILIISHQAKGLNGVAMVSRSGDGEIIAQVLQRQGQSVVRGSTGRGGLRALARQIKLLKEAARPGGMIPDGPQGPRYRVQSGIITLAQKTGYTILPISYSARKIKVFDSWDRFVLPYPFTRCRLIYGEPVVVPPDADRAALEACRVTLEKEMRRITFVHDRHFGHEIR
jgi:hypothetical protein